MIEFLKKTRLNIPFRLKEMVYVNDNLFKENENITFDKLAEVHGLCMRENATFTAPALAKSGYVYVSEKRHTHRTGAGEVRPCVCAGENATFTAPSLAKSGLCM